MQFRAARCTRMAAAPAWIAASGSSSSSGIAPRWAQVTACVSVALHQRAAVAASLSSRPLHTAAAPLRPSRPLAAPSASSSAVIDAELDGAAASDSLDLSRSYFPFGDIPPAFPLQGFPLCRVAYGGTPRPGNTAADASAAVKSYLRLGGNLVELQRGFSFDMIDAFKELIVEDRIAGDVVLCASVSSADLIGFIDTEEERWNQAQRRAKPAAAAMAATATGTAAAAAPGAFVSELLPSGVRAPTTAGDLLPLLSRVLPLYLRHFLSLHDLESVDVLLLEPPSVNLNAEKVPDASFAWMGGVDSKLTVTEDGFVEFAAQWFEQLERAQRAGLIKSYGLSSARVTMMPYAAQLAPEAAKAAAASSSGLPPAPAAPHGSKFYVPLQRIIDAARTASAKVGPSAAADAAAGGQSTTAKDHNLSTLKFPFSLFNAHKLLYPPPGHSEPSFFEQSRAAGLLCLGDLPLDDSEPRFNEWIRFQECPSQDSKNLLKHYRESMQKITNLEYVYKLLLEESGLPAEALPPRIPDFSWGGLIHSHQNDVYNVVTWETLLHNRIRPSLASSVPRLKALSATHPKLADWAARYAQAAPEACKRFQHAVEHTTAILNEKINERLVAAVGRLAAFPSLEEKALLVLLSTPIGAVLTDQTPSVHLLAQSLSREHDRRRAEGKAATDGAAVTVTSALRPFLLTPAELRTVLDMLQSEVAAILPVRVMMDDLRKKKPATLR